MSSEFGGIDELFEWLEEAETDIALGQTTSMEEVFKTMTEEPFKITYENTVDEDGNPYGGWVSGIGLSVSWQAGPRKEFSQRGALVEDLIEAIIQRIEFYQESKFACTANANALEHLKSALAELEARTASRIARGVEGTHAL